MFDVAAALRDRVTAVGLFRGEDGQDMTEYALMLGLVALFLIGTIVLVGGWLNQAFLGIVSSLEGLV